MVVIVSKTPIFKLTLNPLKLDETRLNTRFFGFLHLGKMCFFAFKSRLSHQTGAGDLSPAPVFYKVTFGLLAWLQALHGGSQSLPAFCELQGVRPRLWNLRKIFLSVLHGFFTVRCP
ncbi:hypothetical protein WMO26_10395 [Solibaculum sp. CLA-JM-H44]|uniref:Uncharacterized protein n=1 Tax=Solibaculum intestinale TaxID=3133165 RepID=A0ABV1E1Q8_9FIRM